jgi:uncharacterized cysteine cluster protein YcgN (CxxCxxCC family)
MRLESNIPCTRCGQCCLAAPCFLISFGKEVYENGIHKCKFFERDENLATCRAYNLIKDKGTCTSYFKLKGGYNKK